MAVLEHESSGLALKVPSECAFQSLRWGSSLASVRTLSGASATSSNFGSQTSGIGLL